jgi:Flp pilus assembly pilin Flp
MSYGTERSERRSEGGASFIEYVFLLALLALVCLAAITLFGQQTDSTHSRNASSIVNGS